MQHVCSRVMRVRFGAWPGVPRGRSTVYRGPRRTAARTAAEPSTLAVRESTARRGEAARGGGRAESTHRPKIAAVYILNVMFHNRDLSGAPPSGDPRWSYSTTTRDASLLESRGLLIPRR